ncbi:heat shock 70 kDa protein 12A-like isoform X2 [Mytilus trossulus]|uniref:heat shock 70 kDa protein 12A-like isoform X2 n=1 Tax=Mytilus trossulus TaxID=6551 RepID=UPI003005325C
MEGILKRKISIFRGYQDRWFLLTKDGLMRQYEKKPSSATQKAKWEMHVMLADIDQKKDGLRFNITSNNGQNIKLKAQSEDEREKWIECLKKWNSNDAEDDEDAFSSDSNQEVRYDEPEPSKGTRKRMESDADILEKFKEITILKKKKDYTMVAAIDFGSAYSGCALSTTNSFIKNPLEILNMGLDQKGNESLKVPTVLLLNPDRKFVAFGHRAEDQYTDLLEKTPDEAHKWYYFSRFKMQLYNNMTLKKSMTIKDITGNNELKAVEVFAFCIEYIWNTLFRRAKEQITNLNEEDIHWVLTVPAIWSENARQFMIEAAKKAGIDGERLTLALEPEAAAFCCKSDETQRRASRPVGNIGSFDTGARFLVVDLGGGTVDITSNEIMESGQLKEIHSASGGPWGGNTINTRIWKLLRGIFGDKVVTKFIAEHRDEYLDLARRVELKKRTVTPDGKITLEIERSLIIEAQNFNPDIIAEEYKDKVKLIRNKLIFSPDVVLQIFKDGIDKIIMYVQDLLDQPETKGVSTILLVGGYAACDLLKDAMKTKFNELTVICPLDPDLAVLNGAVIMGHMDTPIIGRIAKFHYGIAFLSGVEQSKKLTSTVEEFHTIIRKGHPIQVNEVVTGYDFPIIFNKEEALIQIYASDNDEPPQIISSDNCRKIGQIRIKLPKFRREARLKIGISTSETEFKVVARDEHTGICFEGVCSFLN